MDILGQEKPSLGYVSHFGVKGMKWGVRKNRSTSAKSKMSDQDIRRQRLRRGAALYVGVMLTRAAIVRWGPLAAATVQNSRNARAGARAAANLLASQRGLTAYKVVQGTVLG